MRTHLALILTLLLLLASTSAVAAFEPLPTDDETAASETYRAGRRALEAENWAEAIAHFGKTAARDEGDADGALYWQAYALFRQNRNARAQAVLGTLEERFPDSNWVDDAQALDLEIRQKRKAPADPESVADEELKLIALNSLMHLDWERVRPILEPILRGSSSSRMMERALFLLIQSDSPDAHSMLLDFARDASRPDVAEQAIEYLTYFDSDRTRAELRSLYQELADAELKESVLEALMLTNDLETILALAKTEPDEELRRHAIEQLGMLDARAELKGLYGTETAVRVKRQILEALMLADDLEALLALARSEPNETLRAEAIEQIGLLDGGQELRKLYRGEASTKIREQIAEALMLAGDTEFLMEIASSDADSRVRRQAVESLGLIGSADARAGLNRLYEQSDDPDVKEQLIESFMLMNDVDTLIDIVENEPDRELRKEALEMLSIMGDDRATDYLLKILADGS